MTGWLKFVGLKEVVKLDLVGDFHRDIRGTKVHLRNPNPTQDGDNAKYLGWLLTNAGGNVAGTGGYVRRHDGWVAATRLRSLPLL